MTEVSQLNARARAGEERHFFPFYFLFGHIIKNLLTELGRSVQTSIAGTDLTAFGLYWRTSVKILPYRPPARLIRTN